MEIKERDKVKFTNLRPWSIGFQTIVHDGDITVGGGQTVPRLSVEEVYEQIQNGNAAFCGVDGYGKHAAFRIHDVEQYRYLFGLDDKAELPEQMDEKLVDNLLKIKDRQKFKERLNEIVLNDGDKKHLAHIVTNRDDLDSFPGWLLSAIRSKTGVKFDD